MKNYNEFTDRFESIPELPISEEMIGAHIEGNLSPLELLVLQQELNKDSIMELQLESHLDQSDAIDDITLNELNDADIDKSFDSICDTIDIKANLEGPSNIF